MSELHRSLQTLHVVLKPHGVTFVCDPWGFAIGGIAMENNNINE